MFEAVAVKLNSLDITKKRILFLGYDRFQTKIIDALMEAGCEVHHTDQKVESAGYDLIVSFGYRHILKRDFLETVNCPILNLHISYLPYNKGAHPNFWSFYENTPSGVTIHLMDDGVDTGPIVFQRYVNFDEGERTFKETYSRLKEEIEILFLDNLETIICGKWSAKQQRSKGTFHAVKDLPNEFSGWDAEIEDEIRRLDKILGTYK